MRRVLSSRKFLARLMLWDRQIAEGVQRRGCPRCGGRLDVANYPRKPRGLPEGLGPEWRMRLSFCCAVDGCRKRMTPPSVRFFGRWLYVAVVAVFAGLLASASKPSQSCGWSASRRRLGLCRRTWSRWLRWWREEFLRTPAGRELQARFLPSCALVSVYGYFSGTPPNRMLRVLSRVQEGCSSVG